jgi:methionyl-tRNA formyltransferase
VKIAAGELGVPVLQPEKVRTPETAAALAAFAADLFVVVAYGRILPQSLLDMPRLGAYNVHASLLPQLRGAAPIQWSIIRGDSETGVSIMRMEAGLDTGPVAATRRLAIADDDTTGTLSVKLADLGAGLLAETLPATRGGPGAVDAAGRSGGDARAAADQGGRPASLRSAGAGRFGAGARCRSLAGRQRDAR